MYWTEGQEKRKWLQHNSNCSQDCPVDVFSSEQNWTVDDRWETTQVYGSEVLLVIAGTRAPNNSS